MDRYSASLQAGFTFPITRSVLWNHEPQGSPLPLHLTATSHPQVRVDNLVLQLLHKHALDGSGNQPGQCTLIGSIIPDSCGLQIHVDRFEPDWNDSSLIPGDIVIPCLISRSDHNQTPVADYIATLRNLHKRLTNTDRVALHSYLCVKAVCCAREQDLRVEFDLVTLSTQLLATPVSSVPLLATPLCRNLLSPLNVGELQGENKMGYLTMDHTRKLIVMMDNDPKVQNLPLVGVWVTGVEDCADPFVWCSCLKYVYCSSLKDRICLPPEPFLLALFSSVQQQPRFYDLSMDGGDIRYQLHAGMELVRDKDRRGLDLDLIRIDSGPKFEAFSSATEQMSVLPEREVPRKTEDKPRTSPAPSVRPQIQSPLHEVPEVTLIGEENFVKSDSRVPMTYFQSQSKEEKEKEKENVKPKEKSKEKKRKDPPKRSNSAPCFQSPPHYYPYPEYYQAHPPYYPYRNYNYYSPPQGGMYRPRVYGPMPYRPNYRSPVYQPPYLYQPERPPGPLPGPVSGGPAPGAGLQGVPSPTAAPFPVAPAVAPMFASNATRPPGIQPGGPAPYRPPGDQSQPPTPAAPPVTPVTPDAPALATTSSSDPSISQAPPLQTYSFNQNGTPTTITTTPDVYELIKSQDAQLKLLQQQLQLLLAAQANNNMATLDSANTGNNISVQGGHEKREPERQSIAVNTSLLAAPSINSSVSGGQTDITLLEESLPNGNPDIRSTNGRDANEESVKLRCENRGNGSSVIGGKCDTGSSVRSGSVSGSRYVISDTGNSGSSVTSHTADSGSSVSSECHAEALSQSLYSDQTDTTLVPSIQFSHLSLTESYEEASSPIMVDLPGYEYTQYDRSPVIQSVSMYDPDNPGNDPENRENNPENQESSQSDTDPETDPETDPGTDPESQVHQVIFYEKLIDNIQHLLAGPQERPQEQEPTRDAALEALDQLRQMTLEMTVEEEVSPGEVEAAVLQKINYVSMMFEDSGDTDLSMEVNALAMKYLGEEQKIKPATTNMSFASRRYMERHNLLDSFLGKLAPVSEDSNNNLTDLLHWDQGEKPYEPGVYSGSESVFSAVPGSVSSVYSEMAGSVLSGMPGAGLPGSAEMPESMTSSQRDGRISSWCRRVEPDSFCSEISHWGRRPDDSNFSDKPTQSTPAARRSNSRGRRLSDTPTRSPRPSERRQSEPDSQDRPESWSGSHSSQDEPVKEYRVFDTPARDLEPLPPVSQSFMERERGRAFLSDTSVQDNILDIGRLKQLPKLL